VFKPKPAAAIAATRVRRIGWVGLNLFKFAIWFYFFQY